MKTETLISRGTVPDKILLSSSSSTWMIMLTWKLADYVESAVEQPYIENIPYSLFEINCRMGHIIDGRGFNLKLNNQNISLLLTHARIKHGRIIEPCQYLKINRTYWLVPTRILANG